MVMFIELVPMLSAEVSVCAPVTQKDPSAPELSNELHSSTHRVSKINNV